MGEWKDTPLSEVADLQPGYAFKGMDFGVGASRGVKIKDVQAGVVPVDTLDALDVTGYNQERIKKYRLSAGDHLITMTGNLGRVATIPDSAHEIYLNQRVAKLLPKPNVVEDFLLYVIKSSDFIDYCITHADSETAQPNISAGTILDYKFSLPPESEQRAIASVLSSLDAKIDLLHRQNKTLEAMAEALFRQWFVEEQWEERAIDEIATRVACGPFGSSIKTETFVSEGVPIISGQHLWGVLMEDNTFNYITPEHAERLSKAKVQRGDVIFTHAGSIGQAALIPENSRYVEYVLSQRQFFMRCDRSKVLPLYVTMYFHTREGKHQLLGNTSTSGVPSIARPVSFLRSLLIPVPPLAIQQEFERVVGSIYEKVQANNKSTNSLAKLRDTLLPKLMSGEVRVEINVS